MSTFIERMQEEEKQLRERMEKLEAFFSTETFQGLHNFERVLLEEQYHAMQAYWRLLNKRIALHQHG